MALGLPDSTFVAGAVTDFQGRYAIVVGAADRVILRASAVGHGDAVSAPLRRPEPGDSLAAPPLHLDDGAIDLAQLEVTARRLSQRRTSEGTVVDVAANGLNRGESVLRVLERSPGVSVDRANGALRLNGRDDVVVLLDGRRQRIPTEALLALLAGMPADGVATLELLTDPGARYDADGTAGVINITRKADPQGGTSASANAYAGYGWREKAGANLQVERAGGRGQLRAGYGFTHDRTAWDFGGPGSSLLPALWPRPLTSSFQNAATARRQAHTVSLGYAVRSAGGLRVDLQFDAQRAIDRTRSENYSAYALPPDSTLSFDVDVDGRLRTLHLNPSLLLATPLGSSGGELRFSADYLGYRSRNPTDIRNYASAGDPTENLIYTVENRGSSSTDISVATGQVDLAHPLASRIELTTGLKYTASTSSNDSRLERRQAGVWTPDPLTVYTLTVREYIAAAHASFTFEAADDLSLSLGARVERWRRRLSDATGSPSARTRPFPSASATYRLAEERELSLSYGSRIERPAFADQTAYLTYSNPIAFFTGNPSLRPTLSDRVSIRFRSSPSTQWSLAYQRETDPIAPYQIIADTSGSFLLVLPQNLAFRRSLEAQLATSRDLTHSWTASLSATAAYRRFRVEHTAAPRTKAYPQLLLNLDQALALGGGWTVEASAWFNSGYYVGGSRQLAVGSVDLGIAKALTGGSGTLRLSASDVLRTQRYRSTYGELTREAFDIRSEVTFRPESTRFTLLRLTYSRAFGGNGESANGGANRGAEEERRRLGR